MRNHNYYRGVMINAGLNYKQPLGKNLTLFAGATFSPEMELKNDLTSTLATVEFDNKGQLTEVDINTTEMNGEKMLLPMNYSLGLGLGNDLKWLLEANYTVNRN